MSEVYKKLNILKEIENVDFNIYVGFDEYVDLVKLGRTKKERLQILIMCYVNNPTIEELKNWTIDDILNYIKDTDDKEFYEQDMVIVRQCIELINKGDELI